ncbi:HsdM family class I SAM-dependent methyltransferase [Ruegeria atlantica]|uniref:HsdM family class I SAM-dependent methyltransferase n=1 Tax=Ruegeria atlantica TaxID=81569 RepID=UPI001479D8BB|nr:Eco57I restriction-modification methylase domain-containing protein [Ruegeria atlantica]
MQHFKHFPLESQRVLVPPEELTSNDNNAQSAEFSELRTRFIAATRQLRTGQGQDIAREVVFQVIEKWWSRQAQNCLSGAGLRDPGFPFSTHALLEDPALQECITRYAGLAAAVSAPMTAYQIGLLYTALLPGDIRSRQGLFFTPPALAKKLVEMSGKAGTDWSEARVLEPSCGSGVVLVTALAETLRSMEDLSPQVLSGHLAARLQACDHDPFCAWISQVMVEACLLPRFRHCPDDLPELVRCGNTLEMREATKFDLIIGNPPFGKTRLSQAQKKTYGRSVYGHPNRYGLFLDHAVANTSDTGVICFITPTSYVSGQSFRNLRTLLRSEAQPHSICFLDQRSGVFDGANQALALSVFTRTRSEDRPRVERVHVTPNESLDVTDLGGFQLPEDIAAPWLLPRQDEHVSLVSAASKLPCRMRDWGYEIRTGPMIWNRYKRRLSGRPGAAAYPLIWSEAVRPDGRFEWTAERKQDLRWFRLETGEDHLRQSDPCILVQRTTSPEQAKRLNAALLSPAFLQGHGSVVIENHLNVIYPGSGTPDVPLEVLNRFLNSDVMDQLLRCLSGSCAVSAAELHALPLPCPSALDRLHGMHGRGAPKIDIEAECWRVVAGELATLNQFPSKIEA